MAYPTIANYSSGDITTNATSTSITAPSGTQAGDLMLLLIAKDGTGTFTVPSGWASFENTAYSAQAVGVFYQKLTGPLTNFTITHASEMTAWILLRIPGGAVPQKGTRVTGNNTTPDPPSFAHTFGAGKEVMWLALMGHDYNRTTNAYPSNFPDNRINSRSNNINGCGISMATLNSTTSPQNPGTFTISATDTWQAYTIAIVLETTYNLTVVASGNGSTTPSVGTSPYTDGSVVSLIATPGTGSYFKKWVVDGSDVFSATTQVTVSSNKTVTAYFADYKELSGICETSVETGFELEFKPPEERVVMRMDSLLNLYIRGDLIEGSKVSLSNLGELTVVEIIEGSTFNLSSIGVLTVNTITEGGI